MFDRARDDAMTPARLAFESTYQHETDYRVLSGPQAGLRVSVLRLTPAAALAMYGAERAEAGREAMMARAGAVVMHPASTPVGVDVLAAVREDHARLLASLPREARRAWRRRRSTRRIWCRSAGVKVGGCAHRRQRLPRMRRAIP